MFNFSLRAFVALFFFLSVSSVYAHNKVVVIPLGGDDVDQCQVTNSCDAGLITISCPSGDSVIKCTVVVVVKMVFLTSTKHDGNLGGLAGADGICNSLAGQQGIGGAFKAWLSDDTGSPSSRFTKSTVPYTLHDGTVIAVNYADLTDGSLASPINMDESGLTPADFDTVWTTTLVGGERPLFGEHCGNWSDNGAMEGFFGEAFATDSRWTESLQMPCTFLSRLMCFEQ
jgi:hypothetical protein